MLADVPAGLAYLAGLRDEAFDGGEHDDLLGPG
jgi:hypothetical protein